MSKNFSLERNRTATSFLTRVLRAVQTVALAPHPWPSGVDPRIVVLSYPSQGGIGPHPAAPLNCANNTPTSQSSECLTFSSQDWGWGLCWVGPMTLLPFGLVGGQPTGKDLCLSGGSWGLLHLLKFSTQRLELGELRSQSFAH